ncbi:MAG TPA: T9SS type A sorting domain-containing protein [Paludibacteraceae bacterium]|nr:T9SS type A sorting domain-containing protein [Paludibacteraceae bacterium]HPO67138.1 T9SS type A sorting domain-containing protein [Paludibacteraceae bacterium]
MKSSGKIFFLAEIKQTITCIIILFLTFSTEVKSQTSWNFDSDLEGWHDLGDGRDVRASWENGYLKMTYCDRTPNDQGSQLWFPAVQVDNLNFSASDYPYLEIYYEAHWPTILVRKILITLTKTDNTVVYSFINIDPAENFISIDIAANEMTSWTGATHYDGQIKSIQLELPHNSSANPATDWFGFYTLIDKIELSATQTPKPDNKKQLKWSFENGFTDDNNQYPCSTIGNPTISTTDFKNGKSALYLDGDSYLIIPANPILNSREQTISFWIKTIGKGQKYSSIATLFSYDEGNYGLALNDEKLVFKKAARVWDNLTLWNGGVWQHVAIVNERNIMTCYINGRKVADLMNVPMTNRSGNIVIGNGGLIAYIDDFSIFNYALASTEIATQGSIPLNTILPWTFQKDLEGWHEIQDGIERDIMLGWEPGIMKLIYTNKALDTGSHLWFPQVEVDTKFDAFLYPYCDIYYQTKDWPVTTPVKALLELTKADSTIVYSFFDVDPTKNFVRVDFSSTIQNSGSSYAGVICKVRLEFPQGALATPAEEWFGASTEIIKIEFTDIKPSVNETWDELLDKSAFIKSGMEKLNRVDYQYQPIGLGGTTMRVDPWGFAYQKAPMASSGTSWRLHKPYLGYEYWWDNAGHRFNPFLLKAGYGATLDPGTITAFNQKLDIRTGELSIDLGLMVDGTSFTSKRNIFVTPDGILVIRVQDNGAPSPLQVNLAIDSIVRIYNNFGIYNVPHDPWEGSATAREQNTTKGIVVTATRPNTSIASLAVAIESSSSVTVSADNQIVSTSEPNGIVTYYVAPTSSFNPLTPTVPWDHAWNAAYAAKEKGYEALRQETVAWWSNYFSRSKISVPDENVLKLYVQSLFYEGVYFGNTKIPPGCNGTDIESFAGAICPEYDLVFSQLALLYSGHIAEAKNIAEWTYNVLPRAKANAVNGITHHNVTRKYDSGAIYTTLMGYDGTLCVQPTEGEGINLYENYPGANASLMALSYLDSSNDNTFTEKALDILKSTTYVSLQDLIYNGKTYQCKNMPNTVQQAADLYGYNQCVKRGIADPGWAVYDGKILIPQTTLFGDTLIAGGVGAPAEEGVGDATWLFPLWWYGVVDKQDKKVLPSYINVAKSNTGDYVFNNGTMGIIAAKLGLGNDALSWLQRFQSDNILYDETCFTESKGQLYLTPEIGAHGSYICNLTQMLLDPDNEHIIDVFPAIPDSWEYRKIGFDSLMVTGGIRITATRDIEGVRLELKNTSLNEINRIVRIAIPRMMDVDNLNTSSMISGKIVNNVSLQPGETKILEYSYKPSKIIASVNNININDDAIKYKIFPNPNSTGQLRIMNGQDVKLIRIYNLKGELVKILIGNSETYFIGKLPQGIYILNMELKTSKHVNHLLLIK